MDPKSDLRADEGTLLLVRKPAGWTSFDVVNKIRHLFGIRKVGHAGTLDPLATGLLIVCTGRKTKEISALVGLEKEYEAEMTLGARTASFDAGTPVLETRSTENITEDAVREVLRGFVGTQPQVPPMWSALKVGGRRLYKYAREGTEVTRAPREISVRSIVPKEVHLPRVRFTVVCSKGTYVRSLVNDMGERLGCLAYLSALERTRIGQFHLADSLTIEELSLSRCARSAGAE
ncbi:MAG TPA: tRNA pseudouridine(55) synthase TruB [Bacteroidota bacterium]|nr:tRNA pseudouridine(55) synthase TruB [Bacteroidota bacterium]